jgi:hypothetical protein
MSATDTPVVDAEIVDDHTDTPAATSTEVVRRERRSEVIRPLDAIELVESFNAYQQLLPRLLTDDDYQPADGKRFVKKSGWRKIATAFDLDVQIIRSTVERDPDGTPVRAEVWARAIAPSGRSMDGDGYCSIDESRFQRQRGRQKLENDLRATATTRAMNRAISGLVGMGEVSAEEVSAGHADAAPGVQAATGEDKQQARDWLAAVLDDKQIATDTLVRLARAEGGTMTTGSALAVRIVCEVIHQNTIARRAQDALGGEDVNQSTVGEAVDPTGSQDRADVTRNTERPAPGSIPETDPRAQNLCVCPDKLATPPERWDTGCPVHGTEF